MPAFARGSIRDGNPEARRTSEPRSPVTGGSYPDGYPTAGPGVTVTAAVALAASSPSCCSWWSGRLSGYGGESTAFRVMILPIQQCRSAAIRTPSPSQSVSGDLEFPSQDSLPPRPAVNSKNVTVPLYREEAGASDRGATNALTRTAESRVRAKVRQRLSLRPGRSCAPSSGRAGPRRRA